MPAELTTARLSRIWYFVVILVYLSVTCREVMQNSGNVSTYIDI